MMSFTESLVEDAALTWLAGLGWTTAHDSDIAYDQPGAERSDPNYRDVLLERRAWAAEKFIERAV